MKPSADGYSTDPDGVVRSIVVVALLSGKADMLSGVENCVKVTQVCVGRSVHIGVGAFVYAGVHVYMCMFGCVILWCMCT